ncbi:hypothetical protein CEXT_801001 [Caerostris extrusa]|uniref:Uncharacterized protein n=1 Tax=Caerostris extrusa TaxID=172846 RepID=A0AAV4WNK9_CAEEX|nr:hypothetical protein CEXT_801001 [Caerostris extrusa]
MKCMNNLSSKQTAFPGWGDKFLVFGRTVEDHFLSERASHSLPVRFPPLRAESFILNDFIHNIRRRRAVLIIGRSAPLESTVVCEYQ